MSIANIFSKTNADGLPVVITDTRTGQQLVLAGKDLPEQGIKIPEKLRYKKKYYPGSDEPVFHVLGAEIEPVEFTGRFWDTGAFSLNTGAVFSDQPGGPLLGGPRNQMDTLLALFRAQNICTVEWGQTIVLRGLLVEAEPTEIRQNVIAYRFVIDPSSPRQGRQTPLPDPTQRQLSRVLDGAAIVAGQLLNVLQILGAANVFFNTNAADNSPGDLPLDLTNSPYYDELFDEQPTVPLTRPPAGLIRPGGN